MKFVDVDFRGMEMACKEQFAGLAESQDEE